MPRRPPAKPKRRSPGAGSVVMRGDNRIAVTLPPDLDAKRRPHYGPGRRQRWASRAQAEAWLAAEVSRLRNPSPQAAGPNEPLGAYLARWHRLYSPGWPARTARAYRVSIRHFRSIGHVRLGNLTHEVIQGALADLQRATWQRRRKNGTPTGPPHPYARATLVQARAILHQALEQLVPHVLPHNPVRRTRLARAQEAEQPVWDAGQADRFLAAVEQSAPHLALAFRLVLRRGLRRGEVLALQRSDLDARRGLLIIDETAGDRAGDVGDTKGRRRREIPLSADLLARAARHCAEALWPGPWLFANPATGRPWSLEHFRTVAHAACQAAGLPPITPKDMRATAATTLLDEGVALARVSQLLGHSNVAITAQFYERVMARRDGQLTRIAQEMDAAFERASEAARDGAPTPLRGTETGR